jgi:hypothetical protein
MGVSAGLSVYGSEKTAGSSAALVAGKNGKSCYPEELKDQVQVNQKSIDFRG